MKRKLINLFKKSREIFYKLINRPRIYYLENPSLKLYNLPVNKLGYYKKNSFTNLDLFELIKSRIKS